MKNIMDARDRFLEAVASLSKATAALDDRELDVRIAQRDGGNIDEAEKARDTYRTEHWYPAYRERTAALKALCDELGINPADLRGAL